MCALRQLQKLGSLAGSLRRELDVHQQYMALANATQ
jgi:hypothetical protein